MENLASLSLNEFLDKLGSDAPAPGGGAVAALSGALGVGLSAMVAHFTVGKKKYAEYDELMKTILTELGAIRVKLVANIEKDAQVFTAVTDAYGLPKSTDDEKAARTAAIQAALKEATLVPFEVMELSAAALDVSAKAIGKCNTHVITDLGAAALLFNAAIKASILNVLINIGMIKDEAFTTEYGKKAQDLVAHGDKIAKEIHDNVLKEISA